MHTIHYMYVFMYVHVHHVNMSMTSIHFEAYGSLGSSTTYLVYPISSLIPCHCKNLNKKRTTARRASAPPPPSRRRSAAHRI